jgi:hypothetical protein
MTAHIGLLIMAMSASDTIQCSSAILFFVSILYYLISGEIEGLGGAATCWDYIVLMFVGSLCMHACPAVLDHDSYGLYGMSRNGLCRSGLCIADAKNRSTFLVRNNRVE